MCELNIANGFIRTAVLSICARICGKQGRKSVRRTVEKKGLIRSSFLEMSIFRAAILKYV